MFKFEPDQYFQDTAYIRSLMISLSLSGHQVSDGPLSKRVPSHKRFEMLAMVWFDKVGQLMNDDIIFDPTGHLRQSPTDSNCPV